MILGTERVSCFGGPLGKFVWEKVIRNIFMFMLLGLASWMPAQARETGIKFDGVQVQCVQIEGLQFGAGKRWPECSVTKGRWFATLDFQDMYQAQYCLGKGGGDWSNGANWSSTAVPVATDSVLIASPNAVTISSAVGTIDKLTVQGSLSITSSGSLTISQAVKSTDILEIAGGVVTNAGSLSLTQSAAFSNPGLNFVNGTAANGTLTNTGTLSINTGFTGSTGACVNFNQTTGGTADFEMGTSGVTLTQASGKTIFNMTAGTAQIGGNVTIGSNSAAVNCRLIGVVGGSLTLLASANITAYVAYSSSNSSIAGASGTVTSLTNNGTLAIHLGTSGATASVFILQPSAGAISTTFTNTGTITIDGAISTGSVGIFAFQGGDAITTMTINNSGTITDTHTGTTVSVYSFSSTSIRLHTITNSGTISFSKGMTLGCAATINNNSGGIVNMSASMTGATGTGAPGTIVNNNLGGTFNFDVSTAATTATNTLTFKNYGTIIGRGVFLTGTFSPQSGGTISPGNATKAVDKFTINGTPMNFSGTIFVMDVNGKTTAGTDFDQVVNSTASSAITMSASTMFNVNVGGSYTPVTTDQVALFTSSGTISTVPTSGTTYWLSTLNTGNNSVLAT